MESIGVEASSGLTHAGCECHVPGQDMMPQLELNTEGKACQEQAESVSGL